jgi:hypothetical protein
MRHSDTEVQELKKMIADYMENGFLENIIDMFKQDRGLYEHIGDLLIDERMRVRIGTAALMETLKKDEPENISAAIPYILPVLKNKNPVYRGDAAYILGIIGNPEEIPFLEEMADDEDSEVRQIVREAMEEILSKS